MARLLYLYGIALKDEVEGKEFSQMKTIDGKNNVEVIAYGECAAIVSPVEEEEFGEEVLEVKTNQMDWVQEKAYLHHEILMKLKDMATLIPMKFCTILESETSLEKKMDAHETEWAILLQKLSGKEEWNVKIYNHPGQLKEQVAEHHPDIQRKREEISQMSKGMQYLQKKKLDQFIDEQVVQEQQSYVNQIHRDWSDLCDETAEKKVWNKSVTGKEEEMCWNCAYLIDKEQVEKFLSNVTKANEEGESSGWHIEVTGPWPVYHFSTLSKSEVE